MLATKTTISKHHNDLVYAFRVLTCSSPHVLKNSAVKILIVRKRRFIMQTVLNEPPPL